MSHPSKHTWARFTRGRRWRIGAHPGRDSRLFPHLLVDLVVIGCAVVVGILLALPLRWHQLDQVTSITVWSIFTHNALLAGVAALLTGVGARVLMVLNGLWLGMGLTASVVISGFWHTVGLTVVHVPLEVCAWAMTIELARRFWPAVLGIRREPARRRTLMVGYLWLVFPTLAVYFIAAVTEWASFDMTWRSLS